MKLGDEIIIDRFVPMEDSAIRIVQELVDKATMKKIEAIDNEIRKEIAEITIKYDIDIDEEKLIQILKGDQERYREAYTRGYKDAIEDWALLRSGGEEV